MSTETLHNTSELAVSRTPVGDKVLETIKTRRIEACRLSDSALNMGEYDAEEVLLKGAFTMFGHAYAQVMVRYEQRNMEDAALDKFLAIYKEKLAQSVPDEVRFEFDEYVYEDVLEEYAKIAMNQAEMDIILAPAIDTITLEDLNPSKEDLAHRHLEGLELEIVELRKNYDEIGKQNFELLEEVASLKRQLKVAQEMGGIPSELGVLTVENMPDDPQRTLGSQALKPLMYTI